MEAPLSPSDTSSFGACALAMTATKIKDRNTPTQKFLTWAVDAKSRNSLKKTAPVRSCASIPSTKYVGTTTMASPRRSAKLSMCTCVGARTNAKPTMQYVCQQLHGTVTSLPVRWSTDAAAANMATHLNSRAVYPLATAEATTHEIGPIAIAAFSGSAACVGFPTKGSPEAIVRKTTAMPTRNDVSNSKSGWKKFEVISTTSILNGKSSAGRGALTMMIVTAATSPTTATACALPTASPRTRRANTTLQTSDHDPRQLSTICGAMAMATMFTACAVRKRPKPRFQLRCP
mmetsp:Transcript_8660/g.22403  ORF Transcript_8660/g.22403 Transcript_8660/m.22403 type:complete len:289 (+) Transcript_8660:285-1151(+)